MTNVRKFLEHHNACEDCLEWAVANCDTMQEVWDTAKPDLLVWVATCEGVLTNKELRLFACFCARQNLHLLTDERSRNAVEVAERFAVGQATGEELSAANAAWAAAWAAANDAANDAAWATTEKEQAEYLRKNCKPNFVLKG